MIQAFPTLDSRRTPRDSSHSPAEASAPTQPVQRARVTRAGCSRTKASSVPPGQYSSSRTGRVGSAEGEVGEVENVSEMEEGVGAST